MMTTTYCIDFKYIRIFLLSMVAVFFAVSFFGVFAQSSQPINIDEIKAGALSPEAPEQYYSLIARAGQILDIEIKRVSGDIIPQFTILEGTVSLGVWYGYKHTTVADDFAGGQIRFDSNNQYTIRVTSRHPNASQGKFVLSVSRTVAPTSLVIDQKISGEAVGGETKTFTFQSISQSPIRVSVEVKSGVPDVIARLKNSRGDILGSFQPPLQEGLFNIPQGQKDYTLEIANTSNGSIIQFSILLTAITSETPSETVSRDNGLPELPNSGECIVATQSESPVNIRPEPSLEQPAFDVMSPFKTYLVTARNQDDTWYQIHDGDHIGWVSAIVTRLGGSCEAVPKQ